MFEKLMFWKTKKVVEPLFDGAIDTNAVTVFLKNNGCSEFVKLLKYTRDSVKNMEMYDVKSDYGKTMFNKGQVNALDLIIANIHDVTKGEIVYAKRSGE